MMTKTIANRQIDWFLISLKDSRKRSSLPRWMRFVGRERDGTIWVPAAIAGPEMLIMATCGDEAGVIACEGHIYVRARWMRHAFPNTSTIIDDIGWGIS